MKFLTLGSLILTALTCPVFTSSKTPAPDFAHACYGEPLPHLPPPKDSRTIPWGTPSIVIGTSTCCSSLNEVRAGIDSVDAQLLELLSRRAGYVREATRFKATRNTVDVPSRDQQVIDRAVTKATAFHLPETIARAVFTKILDSSVSFELCVFDSFGGKESR